MDKQTAFCVGTFFVAGRLRCMKKRDMVTEYIDFLKKFGIEYDEKYVFKSVESQSHFVPNGTMDGVGYIPFYQHYVPNGTTVGVDKIDERTDKGFAAF
jgi:hypothetical protein